MFKFVVIALFLGTNWKCCCPRHHHLPFNKQATTNKQKTIEHQTLLQKKKRESETDIKSAILMWCKQAKQTTTLKALHM